MLSRRGSGSTLSLVHARVYRAEAVVSPRSSTGDFAPPLGLRLKPGLPGLKSGLLGGLVLTAAGRVLFARLATAVCIREARMQKEARRSLVFNPPPPSFWSFCRPPALASVGAPPALPRRPASRGAHVPRSDSKIRLVSFINDTTRMLHDSAMLGPSHPDTKARCAVMVKRPYILSYLSYAETIQISSGVKCAAERHKSRACQPFASPRRCPHPWLELLCVRATDSSFTSSVRFLPQQPMEAGAVPGRRLERSNLGVE